MRPRTLQFPAQERASCDEEDRGGRHHHRSIFNFASLVNCRSIPGINTRHSNVDIVVVREQTEGEYSSLEHESVPGVVEMLKVTSRQKSTRIARFAFDYALKNGRTKVGDTLLGFLKSCY